MSSDPKASRLVKVFARNVRKRRLELGLTQEELSEAAHLHRTYIGMIERREKNVTIYNIERLASALETTAALLLADD